MKINYNLLQSEQLSNYINNLVVVRQTVNLYSDYVSIRTGFNSGLAKEIAYISVSPPNITIGSAIDDIQNVMLNSLYNIVYNNIIQTDDTQTLYAIIISLISEFEIGFENSFAQFALDIYNALNP